MEIIDGKKISDSIKKEISEKVETMVAAGKKRPHLVAVLVGDDGASRTYVASKEKACLQVGFESEIRRFPADITEVELLEEVKKLNEDDRVDGFIVQLPLPSHIDENKVIEAIDPSKDVDGFHPSNVGKSDLGLPCFLPATPYGIITLLERSGIDTRGKHCVVLGRSNIVGRPIANLLMRKAYPGDCTVTVCHSRTKNIAEFTRNADIIIAAIGIPEFLKGDMVKEGAVVIDVGTTRIERPETKTGFKLVGDVAFDEVAPKCSYITPVPGGVGPMTIVSLMQNTLTAVERKYAE